MAFAWWGNREKKKQPARRLAPNMDRKGGVDEPSCPSPALCWARFVLFWSQVTQRGEARDEVNKILADIRFQTGVGLGLSNFLKSFFVYFEVL